MKRKREKISAVSELMRERLNHYLSILGYKTPPASELDWANVCDNAAIDIMIMLDDMEEDETDN